MSFIWAIIAIILAIWLAGVLLNIAGNLIHLLLIIALAVFIFRLLQGKTR
ncbi:lmo0937 family membrane protein [Evansella tamaricis]|uniref:Lmo0937 family membrane protein n=1 Tax=Evansella tamaricis TaxID=2069301 RepID=A0ABS6JGJ4_9BACI|nr:lmo0937 family membrane protein [Evansella tamaricis]MBU9712817.1 lmo0937 family membrane protein [Evansella tamaricis]